ncbi:MAG: hypothetical protein ABI634_11315 [Acidobacteriota bacterium]
MKDPILDLISQLPPAIPAPDRTRRTQARCHRVLARHTPVQGVAHPLRWPAWSPALIGLAALYVADAMWQVAQVYGVR